jgi:hypothetical protein
MRLRTHEARGRWRRRLSGSAAGLIIGIAISIAVVSPAQANFPHFKSLTVTTVDSSTATSLAQSASPEVDPAATLPDLQFSWTEIGLGTPDVTYRASSVVTAVFGCVNNGSMKPSAGNKVTMTAPVSAEATLTADRNGRISGSLVVDTGSVVPQGFSCPSGQTVTALSATFSELRLTDLVNDVTVTADDILVVLWP